MDPLTIALSLATKFAPDIIKHFSNSETAGTVAGKVIDIAQAVTGKKLPEEAQAALDADPALASQFRLQVAANNLELVRLADADRKDARARDVAIRQIGYNWRADILVLACVAALIYIIYAINTNVELKPEVLAIFNMSIGALLKMLGDAFAFEFGSSRGSKEKDELIAGK